MNDLNLPWRQDPKSKTDILDCEDNVIADTCWHGTKSDLQKDETRAEKIVGAMKLIKSIADSDDGILGVKAKELLGS